MCRSTEHHLFAYRRHFSFYLFGLILVSNRTEKTSTKKRQKKMPEYSNVEVISLADEDFKQQAEDKHELTIEKGSADKVYTLSVKGGNFHMIISLKYTYMYFFFKKTHRRCRT